MHLNATLDLDVVAIEAEDQISVLLELAAPAADDLAHPPAQHAPGRARPLRLDGRRPARVREGRADRPRRPPRADGPLRSRRVRRRGPRRRARRPSDRQGHRSRPDREHPARRHDQPQRWLPPRPAGGAPRRRQATAPRCCSSPTAMRTRHPDSDKLGSVAAGARSHRVTTSTIGIGLGYDETLLAALARGGAGNTHFAEDGDTGRRAARVGGRRAARAGRPGRVAHRASRPARSSGDPLFNDLASAPDRRRLHGRARRLLRRRAAQAAARDRRSRDGRHSASRRSASSTCGGSSWRRSTRKDHDPGAASTSSPATRPPAASRTRPCAPSSRSRRRSAQAGRDRRAARRQRARRGEDVRKRRRGARRVRRRRDAGRGRRPASTSPTAPSTTTRPVPRSSARPTGTGRAGAGADQLPSPTWPSASAPNMSSTRSPTTS